MAIVYRHVRLDTNKVFYVGIGENIKRAYIKSKQHRNNFWINITNKCDYKVEILFENVTWEEACLKEKELIQLYGRVDLGLGTLVNLTDGGEGSVGMKHSIKTLNKMSEIAKKRPARVWTEESKLKLSNSLKGRPPSNKGKSMTEETKLKISQSMNGRKLSEETKSKMRKPKSEIHKQNISKGIKKIK
jgi:hypothetical protein